MAYYNKRSQTDGTSAEDKALDRFAELMIEKIESLKNSRWQQPWFTEGSIRWPSNLSGREYNGMNALLLMMLCEKEKYTLPVFCTFNRAVGLNYQTDKQGNKVQALNADGEPLPRVSINKGEKSFPVMLTSFTVIDKETKEKIKYEDYKQLDDESKKQYNVYPKLNVYQVFNVNQTNLKTARPELYAKLEAGNQLSKPFTTNGETFSFPAVDTMIADGKWICPISLKHQDNAFFSISKNEIVLPEKSQFKDGESFYGTAFHEMVHSTGTESLLNRFKPGAGFGYGEYAREELVAELGSALVAQRYGMTKNLKEDSAAYLKSWLGSLRESPEFIKTTLTDVKRATSILVQHVDNIAQEIKQSHLEEKSVSPTDSRKSFYTPVAYLQSADDTNRFDCLKETGDYECILQEAMEYDAGDAPDLEHTYKRPLQHKGDDLLIENEHYAVVYNNSVGGTYEIMRKIPDQEVREHITRYGLPSHATEDVKAVAKGMVAEGLASLAKDRQLIFEMPNGEILHFEYDGKNDRFNVGGATNAGLVVRHIFNYDHNMNLADNLHDMRDMLETMPEYQEQEQEVVFANRGWHR